MLQLKDVLTISSDFEGRVAALEENYAALDDDFAARTARALESLPLDGPYATLRDNFVGEIRQRGTEALYDPQSVFSGQGTLRELAEQAGGKLRSRLLSAADSSVASVTDGVIQALLDIADEPDGDELALETVCLPMREVAFSPRRMSGRQVAYIVEAGDDLRSVALKLYGDPERWEDVVKTYDLQPPYQLRPGMALVQGNSRLPDAEVGHLGETMKLSAEPGEAGDYQHWDIVPQVGGGIATVEGLMCLATDCALRLATPLGDLPEYPTYGMPKIAGQDRNGVSAAQYLMATETLKGDARVGSVRADSRIRGLKLLANVTVVPASSENVSYGF